MAKKDLLIELRCLQVHLNPVLSQHFKNVLGEIERELTPGGVSTPPAVTFKKSLIIKPTKKALVNKYLNR